MLRSLALLASALMMIGWLALCAPAARVSAEAGRFAVTETATPMPTDTPLPTATFTQPPLPTATPSNTTPPDQPPATPSPGLQDPLITKRADLERAVTGDLVTFTITVLNPNDVEVPGVSVTDALPPQLDFLDGSATAGSLSYAAGSHSVTFTIGTLAARQEVILTLRTRVNALGQPPDVISNLAALTYQGGAGQLVSAQSNAVAVQLVPGNLPSTGYGPGPRERLGLILSAVLGAALLGLTGWAYFARRR